MDLNVNKLPETDDSRLKPNIPEEAPLVQPEPRDSNALLKVAAFLTVVIVLTGLAINSHYQGSPATMASDTPPAVAGATTMPAATAPTERATTGAASTAPTIAPNPPSEAAEGKNSNQ